MRQYLGDGFFLSLIMDLRSGFPRVLGLFISPTAILIQNPKRKLEKKKNKSQRV